MKELPEGLPPLPEGAVYLGRGGEFERVDDFHGWMTAPPALDAWLPSPCISGLNPSIHYAAPTDSEIARLNGSQESSKPSWDDAPDWAGWIAQDADGSWWWYEQMPKRGVFRQWVAHGGDMKADFSQSPQPNLNWRETLERRPSPTDRSTESLAELARIGQEMGDYTLPLTLVIPYHLIDWSRVEGYIELGYRLEIDCDGLRGWCHD